jgi:hypothetical protein
MNSVLENVGFFYNYLVAQSVKYKIPIDLNLMVELFVYSHDEVNKNIHNRTSNF